MELELSFGPSGIKKSVIFYVVPNCPSPLIGWPTIVAFELLIDSKARQVIEQGTGLILNCSSAACWTGGIGKKPEPEMRGLKEEKSGEEGSPSPSSDPKN